MVEPTSSTQQTLHDKEKSNIDDRSYSDFTEIFPRLLQNVPRSYPQRLNWIFLRIKPALVMIRVHGSGNLIFVLLRFYVEMTSWNSSFCCISRLYFSPRTLANLFLPIFFSIELLNYIFLLKL